MKPSGIRGLFLVLACDFIVFTRIRFGPLMWACLFIAYVTKNFLLMFLPVSLPYLYFTWGGGVMILLHGFITYFSPPIPKHDTGRKLAPEFLLAVVAGLAIWYYPVEVVEFVPITSLFGYPNPFGSFGTMASEFIPVFDGFLNLLAFLIPAGMMFYDICERNEAPEAQPEPERRGMAFPDAQ